MPIRWRLTLWFSLILMAILILSGLLIYNLMKDHLYDEIDDHLRIHSAKVHGTLPHDEIPNPVDYDVIHNFLPEINEFAFPGIYIQIIDRDGRVISKSDNLGDQELPFDPLLIEKGFAGEERIGSVSAGEGADLRIQVSPLFFQDQVLLLEVAESEQHVEDTLSQLRWLLLAAVLGGLAVAVITGSLLSRRALTPVKRITGTALEIEQSADLSQRVGYAGPNDEVGRLAATFDRMLERLEKVLWSQQEFVADASHDLRSPLAVLKGNIDLLKRDTTPESRELSLMAIDSEIERMTDILNDLLLLAEIESGQDSQQERVSLKEALEEGIDQAHHVTGSHTITEGHIEDLYVEGNRHRIEQLLANLISNAIKYTPDGGTITLSVYRNGPWACLEVADAGIGIAPEHLPHVFDRFYRVDRARTRKTGSTGLGLAIVKRIAEKQGGKVTVQSEPQKGSTFTAWLKL